MTKNALNFISNRAREVSTWQGIAVMLTAFGVQINPEQWHAITGLGTGIFTALSVFIPEKK